MRKLKTIFIFYRFFAIGLLIFISHMMVASEKPLTGPLTLEFFNYSIEFSNRGIPTKISFTDLNSSHPEQRIQVTTADTFNFNINLEYINGSRFSTSNKIRELETEYRIDGSENVTSITFLHSYPTSGVVVERRYTFREQYVIEMRSQIQSNVPIKKAEILYHVGPIKTNTSLSAYVAEQGMIRWLEKPEEEDENSEFTNVSFFGTKTRYFLFTTMVESNLGKVIPKFKPERIDYQFQDTIKQVGDRFGHLTKFYIGPKKDEYLVGNHPEYSDLHYSSLWEWMRYICFGFSSVLGFFVTLIGDFGVAIIALAFAIRIILLPVSHMGQAAQKKTNEALEKAKPEIKEIEQMHKDDPARIYLETKKVYDKYGISPLGQLKGMVSLFIQIPIFIALYHILNESYELRGLQFLWISDLSLPDRLFNWGIDIPYFGEYFNALPILMSLVTVLSTINHSSGRSNDKGEKTTLYLMTGVFFVLFYSFPAGLVLYWTSSNLFQWIHQKVTHKNDKIPQTEKESFPRAS